DRGDQRDGPRAGLPGQAGRGDEPEHLAVRGVQPAQRRFAGLAGRGGGVTPVRCAACQRVYAVCAVTPGEPCPFCGWRAAGEKPADDLPAVTKPPAIEFTVITEKTIETARQLVKQALGESG